MSLIQHTLMCCLLLSAGSTRSGAYRISYKREVPILCYHHIRINMQAHKAAYTISYDQFSQQIEMLADSGYHTILPDQLYDYLSNGTPLPQKPIMITFDDTNEEQFNLAEPVLTAAGFKGVFFIMTIPIGKAGYMNATQIKNLAAAGHAIENHSWDHPDVRRLADKDWEVQITQPKQDLERITGKPVVYFSYPYGAWNDEAIQQLKERGVKAAFQLSEQQSAQEPLYTIRRLMVPGNWSPATLHKQIKANFK